MICLKSNTNRCSHVLTRCSCDTVDRRQQLQTKSSSKSSCAYSNSSRLAANREPVPEQRSNVDRIMISAEFAFFQSTVICRKRTFSERPTLSSGENFCLSAAFKSYFSPFCSWNTLLWSYVVRTYCYLTYKAFLYFFADVWNTTDNPWKPKNVGIRPLSRQKRRLEGVLFRHMTV